MRISDWSSDVCSSDLLSLRVFEVVDVEVAKVALGTAKALSHDAVGLGYTFRADDLGVCFHLGAVAFRHCGADSNLAVPFGLGELGLSGHAGGVDVIFRVDGHTATNTPETQECYENRNNDGHYVFQFV